MLSILYTEISDVKKLKKSVQSFLDNVYDNNFLEFIFVTNKFANEIDAIRINCKYTIVDEKKSVDEYLENICGEWFWIVKENLILNTKNFDLIFDYYETGIIFGMLDEDLPILNLETYKKNSQQYSEDDMHRENYLRFVLENIK